MSSQDIKLYLSENLSFKQKFIHLMNLLVINQSYFDFQNYLFYIIFSIQNISIFFSENAGCLNHNKSTIDFILFKINEIIRIKSLFFKHRYYYNLSIYLFSIYYILFTIYYLILILKTTRKTVYTISLQFLNFFIKVNIFVLANIILDFFTRMLCFDTTYNRNIKEIKCNQSNNIKPLFFSFFFTIYSTILTLYIQLYYEENFFISDSKFNTITSKIYIFQHLSAIISSISLSLINVFSHEFFYIINIIISSFLFYYYIKRLIYYNLQTNFIFGLSHVLFFYCSIYFTIFYFVDFSYKGLIFIITSLLIGILFIIILNNIIIIIVKKTPFFKIKNRHFLLFYIKYLFDLTNISIENQEKRTLLKAIIEMHSIECPNQNCILKDHNKLYLPVLNCWTNRTLPPEIDQIFLKNFIPIVLKYFIEICYDTPELLMNLSYYYLKVIENYCMSLYYFYRANERKLNLEENFLLERLKIMIKEKLYEDFKEEGEVCNELSELNPTSYFKYNDIAENFIKEIQNEINLNIEFWDIFWKKNNNNHIHSLNFKKIFKLIEKIHISKDKINDYWNDLFKINPGINYYFDIYLNYITEINDNNNLKNELETLKKKKDFHVDHLINDYNVLLFKNDTGIVIVKGDKGKEGIIEKANYEFGKIFQINHKKIIGKKITEFMPKVFAFEHKKLMRNFFSIGEKNIINKGQYDIFALDHFKRIIHIKKNLKIFPMINKSLFYIALINANTNDDLIILNSNFIIQGMSSKLFNYFEIDNDELFIKNDIPFYLICKNFINFYRTFFKGKKKKNLYSIINQTINKNSISPTNTNLKGYNILINNKENNNENDYLLKDEKEKIEKKKYDAQNIIENIEINENMEIEYEIKFPDFLSKYSFYTKDIVTDTHIMYKKKNEKQKKISNSPRSQRKKNLYSSTIFLTKGYSPNEYKEQDINFQMNGIKNILQYKSLFEEEKFNELEELFDENTKENYIPLKFHFSFEKKLFGDNNCYYIIKCVENEKFYDREDSHSINIKYHPQMSDLISFHKVSSLYKLYEINKSEKKTLISNLNNYSKLSFYDLNFKNLIEKNIFDIKTQSRVHGDKYYIQGEHINQENSSQNSNSSYNKNITRLHKISNIRNKNYKKNFSSFIIIQLKILPFILLFIIVLFVFIFNHYYSNLNKELVFVRNYNNVLYNFQMTLIQILINVIDYVVLFYTEFYNYDFHYNFELENKELFISEIRKNISKLYNGSNYQIIFLEKHIHKYVKNVQNKVWERLKLNYSIDVPWNDSDFFPIIAQDTLYDSYLLFTISDLFVFNVNEQSFFDKLNLVEYATYMSINGVINIILPKLINSIDPLLNDFINFSNKLYDKFIICIVFYFISNIIIYFLMIFNTFTMIQHLNNGIFRITKIRQNDIRKIMSNITNFKYDFFEKIKNLHDINIFHYNEELNESKYLRTVIAKSRVHFETTIHNTKRLKEKTSISISDYIFEKEKNKKITFPLFSIVFYIFFLFFLLFFSLNLLVIPKALIRNNSNLIISHTYILQQFLYTSTKIFQMKSLFANYNNIIHLNINEIENENLSTVFYDTIPQFKEFKQFYYTNYLLDTCKALYQMDSINYYNCIKIDKIYLINNTNSLRQYINGKINFLIYYYENLVIKNSSFNSYYMFTINDYIEVNDLFLLYFPIYDRFHYILSEAFNNKSRNISKIMNFLLLFLFILILGNIFIQYFFYIPFFQKMLFISFDFIKIIPCNIILNTPDLENWLETIENT